MTATVTGSRFDQQHSSSPNDNDNNGNDGGRRRRRVLWSSGGLVLAGLLGILGVVMTSNASFAETYVKDQLSQQHIVFKSADALTPEEKASPCLMKYAGQLLTTGKQAECYANDYIGLHVKTVAGGQTYADMGVQFRALTAQVAAAQAAGDPALPDLQKQLATVTGQRSTLFQGETSRGLLLTSFGFSDLGVKAGQAATAAYAGAGGIALLSLVGFVSAAVRRQPKVAPLVRAVPVSV